MRVKVQSANPTMTRRFAVVSSASDDGKERRNFSPSALAALASCLQQLHDRQASADREEAGGEHRDQHVDAEPGRLQRRRERCDVDVEVHGRQGREQHDHAGDVRAEEPQVAPDLRDQEHPDDDRRAGQGELEQVGPRHPSGGEGAQRDRGDVDDPRRGSSARRRCAGTGWQSAQAPELLRPAPRRRGCSGRARTPRTRSRTPRSRSRWRRASRPRAVSVTRPS